MYCIAQSITLVHCVVLLIDCDRPTGPATPQALAMTAARLLSGPCCSKLAVQRSVCARPVSITSSSSKVKPLKLRHWPISAGSQDPFDLSSSSGNGKPESIVKESDLSFVGKLVVVSFAGAFLIKYGSLLISLPFEPNGAVATGIVLGTPALYSLYLLTQKQQ